MDALTPPPSRPRPAPAPAAQEAAGHPAAGRRGHLRLVTTGAVRGGAGAAPPGMDGRRAAMPELTRRPSAPRRPPRPCGAARTASRRAAARPVPSPSRTDPALGGADADHGRAPSRSDPARLHPAVRAQRRRREAARTPGRAAPTCAPAVVRAAAPASPAAPALPAVAVVLRRAGAAGLAALAPFLLALVGIALIG